MAERKQPEHSVIYSDLCDHWVLQSDHRCTNYWKHEIVLDEPVEVDGQSMFGTYRAGVWRFCNTHNRIFQRDRRS